MPRSAAGPMETGDGRIRSAATRLRPVAWRICCLSHLRPVTAGHWHGLPERVVAPQWAAWRSCPGWSSSKLWPLKAQAFSHCSRNGLAGGALTQKTMEERPMPQADECRTKAQECEEIARQHRELQLKQLWEDMANKWRQLAEKAAS
jgi:hypothetical protein